MVCDLEIFLISEKCQKAPCEALNGEELPGMRYFHAYGEMGVENYAASNVIIKACLGTVAECACMLDKPIIPKDTYIFLNVEKNSIIQSQDANWMGKTYGKLKG